MKERLWAVAWLAFLIGTIVATKGFEPRLEYEVFTWWGKLSCGVTFALTMFLGFMAGKEYQKER